MRNVLDVRVDDHLFDSWRHWFAPPVQPFNIGKAPQAVARQFADAAPADPSDEVRDTFRVYSRGWVQFDREGFEALPVELRRALVQTRPRGERKVRWRDSWTGSDDEALIRWVRRGVLPSRHAEVDESTWADAAAVLPDARRIVGSYPQGSGPNCFATVMAAAGVAGAESQWMVQEPFQRWLAHGSEPVRGPDRDREAGTVLVWSDSGLPQHAAVTIGSGWALHKPSQAWCSPRMIWSVSDLIRRNNWAGARLSRHRLLR